MIVICILIVVLIFVVSQLYLLAYGRRQSRIHEEMRDGSQEASTEADD